MALSPYEPLQNTTFLTCTTHTVSEIAHWLLPLSYWDPPKHPDPSELSWWSATGSTSSCTTTVENRGCFRWFWRRDSEFAADPGYSRPSRSLTIENKYMGIKESTAQERAIRGICLRAKEILHSVELGRFIWVLTTGISCNSDYFCLRFLHAIKRSWCADLIDYKHLTFGVLLKLVSYYCKSLFGPAEAVGDDRCIFCPSWRTHMTVFAAECLLKHSFLWAPGSTESNPGNTSPANVTTQLCNHRQ